jgi:hypothetical protein
MARGPQTATRSGGSLLTVVLLIPGLALAQSSPFMTGATALQTNILAWLTPIAVILVMVLGAMAMANRMFNNLEYVPHVRIGTAPQLVAAMVHSKPEDATRFFAAGTG